MPTGEDVDGEACYMVLGVDYMQVYRAAENRKGVLGECLCLVNSLFLVDDVGWTLWNGCLQWISYRERDCL